jgi:hypothetical protein
MSRQTKPFGLAGFPVPWQAALLLAGAVAFLAPPEAGAQVAGPPGGSPPGLWSDQVGVELFRPHFKSEDHLSTGAMSGGILLTLSGPVGARTALRLELPVAWGSIKSEWPGGEATASGTTMGNPVAGVRAALGASGASWFEGAVALPVGTMDYDKPGLMIGFVSDPVELQRWMRRTTTVTAGLGTRRSLAPELDLELAGSVGYGFTSEDGSDSDPFARYTAGVHGGGQGLAGSLLLKGYVILGDDFDSLMDRMIHTLEAEVGTAIGRSRVSGFARVPLKEIIRDTAPVTLGLRVAVPIRSSGG